MTPEPAPAHRYAIYFAPRPGSAWWEAGSRWLGRCAATGTALEQPAVPGVSRGLFHRLTAEPRRYGWHGTLKAPFVPAGGIDSRHLRQAVGELARRLPPVELPPLRVRRLDRFLALLPAGDTAALDALAGACVTELHGLAAPLPAAELERRRRKAVLSPRQDELLRRWGYPHVLDHYRFHLSITGDLAGLEPAVCEAVGRAAEAWFEPLPAVRLDSLALFAEQAPGGDFALVEHFGLKT